MKNSRYHRHASGSILSRVNGVAHGVPLSVTEPYFALRMIEPPKISDFIVEFGVSSTPGKTNQSPTGFGCDSHAYALSCNGGRWNYMSHNAESRSFNPVCKLRFNVTIGIVCDFTENDIKFYANDKLIRSSHGAAVSFVIAKLCDCVPFVASSVSPFVDVEFVHDWKPPAFDDPPPPTAVFNDK